jgi:hypothetical protein
MSTPEVQTESKGSVKISRNAKGEPQFEVKVYVGESAEDLDPVREVAIGQYNALYRDLGAAGS